MPLPTTRPAGRASSVSVPIGHAHVAVGRLVALHTALGRTVSVPIGDAPYDLVVDDAGDLTCVRGDGEAVARPRGGPTGAHVQLRLFPPAGPRGAASRRAPGSRPHPADLAPTAPVDLVEAPTGIGRANPRDQGALGFGDAVGWFAAHGYLVSIPLIDNQPYDLIVDDGRALSRVQVKTTRRRSRYGVFVVMLETAGGNQSFHTRKPFDRGASELLYVLTDAGGRYLIPTSTVGATRGLSLGARVARFRVA